ncbi:hypothetical protein [Alienimonas chondri]|uniref:hypothetical protein n=1 Tax=Alienimonas chondri TaxID=2681879 RepID=UPI0014877B55|nr:hypothetical protein [Alienimonas chondri]
MSAARRSFRHPDLPWIAAALVVVIAWQAGAFADSPAPAVSAPNATVVSPPMTRSADRLPDAPVAAPAHATAPARVVVLRTERPVVCGLPRDARAGCGFRR